MIWKKLLKLKGTNSALKNKNPRDIILFLVKKLQYEEKQRLKTEEQANEMIFSMQRTLRQIVRVLWII